VTSVKITGGPPPVERTQSDPKTERLEKGRSSESGEAVQFNRDDTFIHQMYETAKSEVEEAAADRVKELRRKIANGEYSPDLQIVAERLLAQLEGGE
tara:strand:- start:429 stop:719 length:291 start_codon:yes stop_codon:yes gene_type:complete